MVGNICRMPKIVQATAFSTCWRQKMHFMACLGCRMPLFRIKSQQLLPMGQDGWASGQESVSLAMVSQVQGKAKDKKERMQWQSFKLAAAGQ